MTQTYSVQLGAPFVGQNPARTVTVRPLSAGRYEVAIDGGPPEVVEARRLSASPGPGEPGKAAATWSLLCDGGGRQRLCDIEGTAPDLKVAVAGGEAVALKLLDVRAQTLLAVVPGAAARQRGPTDVRSPMPGKVVKVLCQVGQAVQAGQGLLIIEAMKMENELRAPCDGVVDRVAAVEGQTVEGGAVVVSIGLPKGE